MHRDANYTHTHCHCETNCQLPLIDLDFDYIEMHFANHSEGEKGMQTAEIYSLKLTQRKVAKEERENVAATSDQLTTKMAVCI